MSGSSNDIATDISFPLSPLLLIMMVMRWFQRNGRSKRCRHPGGIEDPHGWKVTRNGVFQVGYDFGDIVGTRATEGLASC